MLLSADGSINNFAPQVLGERNPVTTNGYFYGDHAIPLVGHWAEYSRLYRGQPTIATVVDKIANAGARLGLKVWKDDAEGGKEEDKGALSALLASPSRTMSPFQFYRWTFATFETYGEAFWLKLRDSSGKVIGLEPMQPERVTVKRSERGAVSYIFTPGVSSYGIVEVPESDVVPFKRYNPDNTMRGLSRLEQLRVTLMNEDAARRASEAFWRNGARPSVVLSHPDELSQGASDRLRQQFDSRQRGVDNFASTVVLEEGMVVTPLQLDMEEMQYIESRKLNMTEVCMVFDVPPPVIHILDHATYSNITEQMRSMYRDTMAPRLTEFESVIDHYLGAEFAPDGGAHVEFDMTDVLRGDFDSRATTATALRNAGIVTGNEAREIIGLQRSDDPKMEDMLANGALAPVGADPAAAPAPVPGSGDDHRVPGDELIDGGPTPAGVPGKVKGDELLDQKMLRDLGGAIGRKRGDGETISRLVKAHADELETYFTDQRAALQAALPKAEGKAAAGLAYAFLDTIFDAPESRDAGEWTKRLAVLLATLGSVTVSQVGKEAAEAVGIPWTPDHLNDLVGPEAAIAAAKINGSLRSRLIEELAATAGEAVTNEAVINDVFDKIDTGLMASTRVRSLALTGAQLALGSDPSTQKTWVVNSPNPRPSHAALRGETVKVGERFSNDMLGPGDIGYGGVAEVAGCTCTLRYTGPDVERGYTLNAGIEGLLLRNGG